MHGPELRVLGLRVHGPCPKGPEDGVDNWGRIWAGGCLRGTSEGSEVEG